MELIGLPEELKTKAMCQAAVLKNGWDLEYFPLRQQRYAVKGREPIRFGFTVRAT